MVIYEWEDVKYLGKVTDPDDYLPVSRSPHIRFIFHLFSETLSPSRKRTSAQLVR